MFKELAKIANKLDGLGLTKEADVLDLYLAKIAEGTSPPAYSPSPLVQQDMGFKPLGDVSLEDSVAYDISGAILERSPQIGEQSYKAQFKQMWIQHPDAPTKNYEGSSTEYDRAWIAVADKYADKMWKIYGLHTQPSKTGGNAQTWTEYSSNFPGSSDPQILRDAWIAYSRLTGVSEEFPAFVSWWKGEKAKGTFKNGGSSAECASILSAKRQALRSPLYNHSEAVASTPQYRGDSSFQQNLEQNLDALDPSHAKEIGLFDYPVDGSSQAANSASPAPGAGAPTIPGPTVRPPGYRRDIAGAGLAPAKLFEPRKKQK